MGDRLDSIDKISKTSGRNARRTCHEEQKRRRVSMKSWLQRAVEQSNINIHIPGRSAPNDGLGNQNPQVGDFAE
jgi:hypothetical protein